MSLRHGNFSVKTVKWRFVHTSSDILISFSIHSVQHEIIVLFVLYCVFYWKFIPIFSYSFEYSFEYFKLTFIIIMLYALTIEYFKLTFTIIMLYAFTIRFWYTLMKFLVLNVSVIVYLLCKMYFSVSHLKNANWLILSLLQIYTKNYWCQLTVSKSGSDQKQN
jgi:hypothetical protein